MQTGVRGRQVLAAVVLALLLVAGCSGGGPGAGYGPLGSPGDPGSLCMAPPTGNAVTVGVDVLEPGDTLVTIDEVSLMDADGLGLIGSYVTAVVGTTTVGTWNTFPPSPADLAESGYRAEQLVAAEGATLDPAVAPAWNLVLGLQVGEGRAAGQSAGVQVAYHADGRDHVWRSSTHLEVRLHPQVCG